MPFSYFTEVKILDHFDCKTQYAFPPVSGGLHLGLSSTTPTKGGSNVTEPSGGNYARKQVAPASFNAAANGACENNADITFNQASADWLSGANITYVVFFDAASGGNLLGYAALTTAKNVLNGDTPKILSGELDLAFS